MLVIDNREGKLIELIKSIPSFTIPYELKNLQIGDIIISTKQHPCKSIIIERKCVQDMLASIKDGRYKEQKIRLQSEKSYSLGNTLICYIIEGNINDVRYPTEKKVFHGSLVSCCFRDVIPLIRTSNLSETLDIITRIQERMDKDITDFFKPNEIITQSQSQSKTTIENITNITTEQEPEQETNTELDTSVIGNISNISLNISHTIPQDTYLSAIKKCKKDNLTPQLWNQISLTNIPGVSTNIATKISEVYPTIRKLFQDYDKCDNDEKRILLISQIILTDNGKVKRRIGEVISKRILEYMY